MSTAIAGLGMTEMGKVYGRTAVDFAVDAVSRAAKDAGLPLSEIDGLLINPGVGGDVSVQLQFALQMRDLRLLSQIQSFGASAGVMLQMASMAIESGMASTVACVFADAPLRQGVGSGAAYSGARKPPVGTGSLPFAAGLASAPAKYAMAARRHMDTYGTTSENFGAVAVATRAWAQRNPLAQMREPLTLDDHQASPIVAAPLRRLDCCLVSNGAIAVIVTSAERAENFAQPPAHIWGWGQSHPGYRQGADSDFGLRTGAVESGAQAYAMAGITPKDVTIREIYDCFTYTTLVTLEDYGFCEKGAGGEFVSSGALGPGGSHPTNTGGGELSAYYMWGMTPLSEAVIQARGHGGERQVANNDVILVSGNGGVLDFHSTTILSPHRKA